MRMLGVGNIADMLSSKRVLPLAIIVAMASSEVASERSFLAKLSALLSHISEAHAIIEKDDTPKRAERKEPPSEEEIIDAVRSAYTVVMRDLIEQSSRSQAHPENPFCTSREISREEGARGFPFVFRGNAEIRCSFEEGLRDISELARDPFIPLRLSFFYSRGTWYNINDEMGIRIRINTKNNPYFSLNPYSSLDQNLLNNLSDFKEGTLVYTHPIDTFIGLAEKINTKMRESLSLSAPNDPPTREGLMLPREVYFAEAALFRGLDAKDFGPEQRFRVIMVTGKEGFELVHDPEYLERMSNGLSQNEEGVLAMLGRLTHDAEKYDMVVNKITGWDVFRGVPTHEIVDYVNMWMKKGEVPFRLKLVELPK